MFPVTDQEGNLLDGVIEITPEEFNGIKARTHGFSDDLKTVVPIVLSSEEIEARRRRDAEAQSRQKINAAYQWFNWYDSQVHQYYRAMRKNSEWSATLEGRTYYTIEELDADADAKQNEIRDLREQIRSDSSNNHPNYTDC